MAIAKLGNVNGFVCSTGWVGNKKFEFDGTIKGLTKSAIANGAKINSIIYANIGGRIKSDARKYKIEIAAHDDRANGFWAVEIK